MRTAFVSALLVAAIGCAATSEALAQNAYQQQIRTQMTRHSGTVLQQGYVADRDLMMGSLNSGAREAAMINLQGGVRYKIIGVCDNDCTDVDLRIFGPDGTKLAEDILTDDVPILDLTAPVGGQYRLSVEMATCSMNPCYWGVQIFVRR